MKHSFRRLVWFLALCPAAQAASSVPLNVTVSNACQITATNSISLSYVWTAASSGSQYSYFECNQSTIAFATVVSATGNKAYNGARYIQYSLSPAPSTGRYQNGTGNGTASTPDRWRTRVSINVFAGQEVPAGTYTSTLNWNISP